MNRRSKKSQPNLYRKFGYLTLFTIFFTIIGYAVTMWLFQKFSYNIAGKQDWDLLGGFVSVLTLSFLIGSIVTTVIDRINADVVESREKVKLSYEIYRSIFEKLTDPDQEAARRWILENISIKKENEDIETWYGQTHAKIMAGGNGTEEALPDGQKFVKMTLNCLDYIGFIAKHYWDIEDDSLDWLSPPVAKVWRRLGPYVLQVRMLRNSADYYAFAKYIGDLCIEWRQRSGLGDEEFAKNTP